MQQGAQVGLCHRSSSVQCSHIKAPQVSTMHSIAIRSVVYVNRFCRVLLNAVHMCILTHAAMQVNEPCTPVTNSMLQSLVHCISLSTACLRNCPNFLFNRFTCPDTKYCNWACGSDHHHPGVQQLALHFCLSRRVCWQHQS